MKVGILLVNLGTPESPSVTSVRHYLREFLWDPRVIDLPAVARWLLLNLFILPFRPTSSAKAYKSIWQENGSPLLLNSQALATALEAQLGQEHVVALGMRYGNPSIESAAELLSDAKCDKIIILPLFPQYSSAATGSAIEKSLEIIAKKCTIPNIVVKSDFYHLPGFIQSQATLIQNTVKNWQPDCYIFSYHGLPERQIANSKACNPSFCQDQTPCPEINLNNRYCYRAQCYETSRKFAQQLNLTTEQYKTTFQSRLGRLPWIRPYTDIALAELAQAGMKNIIITCPSFVCDCLETLEEMGIRGKEQWQSLGGENFELVPCVNDHPLWIKGLAEFISG